MQSELIVGDSLNMLDSYADYPASEGWTLKTTFTPRLATSSKITLTATAELDSYRTQAAPATTSAWVPGDYSVHQTIEKAGQRITVATGKLRLLPDPASVAPGYDDRSHLEKVIANIEAMLEGKTSKDVQEYSIAGRMLKHIPINELLALRDKYKHQLAAENRTKSSSFGLGRKIYSRF